jgi:phosphoglycolate phosphatase-like HAD superfamily hydrolase
MNLAIFDVDGTLTRTNDIDSLCYVRAVQEELDIDVSGLNWADFTFVTDIGITNQMFLQRFGRLPEIEEIERLQRRLVRLLEEAHGSSPESFAAVAGAVDIIDWLQSQPDWRVGIATGCWQASAQLKLRAARIGVNGIPAAYCEDGQSREEVVRAAIERSRAAAQVQDFERIVSIGDGIWDIATAVQLSLAFVGVCVDGRDDPLRRRGATHVVRDFSDRDEILRSLREAGVPRTSRGRGSG